MGSIMRTIVIGIYLLCNLGSLKTTPTLALYYESLCPTSRAFIAKEVWPSYQVLSPYMAVLFVAYGKAQTNGSIESGYTIECHRGEEECQGNIIQACTVKYVPDMMDQA